MFLRYLSGYKHYEAYWCVCSKAEMEVRRIKEEELKRQKEEEEKLNMVGDEVLVRFSLYCNLFAV